MVARKRLTSPNCFISFCRLFFGDIEVLVQDVVVSSIRDENIFILIIDPQKDRDYPGDPTRDLGHSLSSDALL